MADGSWVFLSALPERILALVLLIFLLPTLLVIGLSKGWPIHPNTRLG